MCSGDDTHKTDFWIIPKCELIQDYKNLYNKKIFYIFTLILIIHNGLC